MTATPAASHASSFAAFQNRGFALYWCARFLASFAVQIVSVGVG